MLKRCSKSILLVLAFLLVFSFGVGASQFPVEMTDDLGREVVIEEEPERIVSLAPSLTEKIYALGLEDRLVAVTEQDNYPPEVEEKAQVGTTREPNLEKIVELDPDLILAASVNPREKVSHMEELGFKVVGLDARTLEGVIDNISRVGELTGSREEAEELTAELRGRKEDVISRVEGLSEEESPKVFYEVWRDPLTTAGPGTFINNIIKTAGGVNIAEDAEQQWPQYSLEVLFDKNPEVYLTTSHSWEEEVTKESVKERDNFQQIKAVEEGRIYVLNPDIINRPGPRAIDALEQIAKALHPELF